MGFNRKIIALSLILLMVFSLTAFSGDNRDKVTVFNNIEIGPSEVITGDCVAIFGNVKINGQVNGDVAAIFGNIILNGKADGDIAAIFGNVTLNGEVGGDMVAVLGKLKLNEGSVVKGDTAAIGGGMERAAGSSLEGEIADISLPFAAMGKMNMTPEKVSTGSLFGLTLLYGLACLLFLIIPERLINISNVMWEKIPKRFGIGLSAFLAFIPVIIILAITLVGILAIPFFILAFVFLVFASSVAMYIAIGKKVTGNLPDSNSVYIYIVVGTLLVFAFKFVPIVGWLTNIVLICIAVGAALDTRFGGGRQIKAQMVEMGPAESIKPEETPKKG